MLRCDKLISGTIKTSDAWIITLEDDLIVFFTTSEFSTTELLKFPKRILSIGPDNFYLFASARVIIVATLPGSRRANDFTETSSFTTKTGTIIANNIGRRDFEGARTSRILKLPIFFGNCRSAP